MSNPAAELLVLFREWGRTREAPHSLRALNIEEPGPFLAHVHAMGLIQRILAELDVIERDDDADVEVYRQASRAWIANVLAYPSGWTDTNASEHLFGEAKIDILQVCADRLKMNNRRDPAVIAQLREFLDQVVLLLEEDDSIPSGLREHIRDLIRQTREAIAEHAASGRFEASERVGLLVVAVSAAENESTSHKGRWHSIRDQFLVPAAAGAVGNVVSGFIQMLTP